MKQTYSHVFQNGEKATFDLVLEEGVVAISLIPDKVPLELREEFDIWVSQVIVPDLLERLTPQEIVIFARVGAEYLKRLSKESSEESS